MTNDELAAGYASTAAKILKEAENLFGEEIWHLVVRRCQESVELFLKAMLRRAGIEIPHIHDVGALFKNHAERFPHLPIERIVSISRRLREEREISFYGDDMTETPAESLYSEDDAVKALADARFVRSLVQPQSYSNG